MSTIGRSVSCGTLREWSKPKESISNKQFSFYKLIVRAKIFILQRSPAVKVTNQVSAANATAE